jgi:hypothetical protein
MRKPYCLEGCTEYVAVTGLTAKIPYFCLKKPLQSIRAA